MADFELDVDLQTGPNLYTNIGTDGFLEAACLDRNCIIRRFEVVKFVIAGGVCFAAPGFIGGRIGNGDFRTRDNPSLRIKDTAGDRASRFLRDTNGRGQQAKRNQPYIGSFQHGPLTDSFGTTLPSVA